MGQAKITKRGLDALRNGAKRKGQGLHPWASGWSAKYAGQTDEISIVVWGGASRVHIAAAEGPLVVLFLQDTRDDPPRNNAAASPRLAIAGPLG